MQIIKYPHVSEWQHLLQRPAVDHDDMFEMVSDLLLKVKREGDSAIRALTLKYDRIELDDVRVFQSEIDAAIKNIDDDVKNAIAVAKQNIETFHAAQKHETIRVQTMKGVTCWQKSVPIEKVGLYIPGGKAPLFSTVLMLAVPARIAGCSEIVLCTPPDRNGEIHPAILYAAHVCGVTKIFKVGGAQAIGAMAYGTETIPQVYKIFGPGNRYVVSAKQIVTSQGVATDMPAGPSEVAVIADHTANPVFVAADLLSQAEHGADSQVILFTTNEQLAEQVNKEVLTQLESLPRMEIAQKSLTESRIFVLHNTDEMVAMSNMYAPEHLIIAMDSFETVVDKIVNAGSVFLGHYSPESVGDYASGTNHTLPTNGFARAYSGVNMDSFVKKITFQEVTREGLQTLAPVISAMADAEYLHAHKFAVERRVKFLQAK